MLITLTIEELQDIIDSAIEKVTSRVIKELRHDEHRSVYVPKTPEGGGLGYNLLRVPELELWIRKQKPVININNETVQIMMPVYSPERPDYPEDTNDGSRRIFDVILESERKRKKI